MFPRNRFLGCMPRGLRTIDATLKFLAADFALEVAHAGLFVKLHGDGLLVVAEEAGECGRERLGLQGERVVSIGCPHRRLGGGRDTAQFRSQRTLLGPCGFLELLRLPCRSSVQSAWLPVAQAREAQGEIWSHRGRQRTMARVGE